jgi:iduronate 2-sulfatase
MKRQAIAAVAFAFATLLATVGFAVSQPNVLYISIEDIAPLMGCYGHPIVKTPNIDALAGRGVVFHNAHCQVAVCNPSRASISSGLRPETTGVFNNSVDWRRRLPEGHRTLPEFFRDHGYETVNCGKIHHHQRYFKDASEEAEAREQRMWTRKLKAPSKPSRRKPVGPKAPRPDWLAPDDYIVRSLKWGPTGLDDTEQRDGATAAAVASFLKEDHKKPFFMAVGFHSPHYALHAPDKYFEMYPWQSIRLPENPSDDLDDVPVDLPHFNTTDHRWLDDDEERQEIAAYYACISYVDTCVGLLTAALDEAALTDNTIVCLWGDHGMHTGDHFLYRKYTLFESSARVPLVITAPEVAKAGTACKRPTELIDMYPTLADLCGLDVPEGLEGISMKPLLADPSRPWKKGAFTSKGRGQTSVRTERWRYTEWGSPDKAELYDHQNDPGEFTNLAGKPEHAATVAELQELLHGGWQAALPE